MKKLCYLFIAVMLLSSCASGALNSDNKKEIATATQRLGEEYYSADNYSAALKTLLEAYETIPDDPHLNNSLGLVYFAKEKYDLAETHFKKALDLKKDYLEAKNNLGAAYLKQEKWSFAIECFEEVSKNLVYTYPERPLSNLGWAYFHQKKYEKAKIYFNKSLEIKPDFLISIHGLASIYIETGVHLKAIDLHNQALTRNPGAPILHSDIAKAYEATNDFPRARKSWEIVLGLVSETSPLAREAKKKLLELN